MKSDKRFSKTEQKIKEAFKALLRKKPMHQISVKELCTNAQINRSTFYDHYSDVYALLDEVERDCFARLDGYVELTIRARLAGNLQQHAETLEKLLRQIRDQDDTFYMLFRCSEEDHFERHLITYYTDLIEQSVQLKDDYERMSLLFHISGSFAVLLSWIGNDYPISEAQMAQIFIRGGML